MKNDNEEFRIRTEEKQAYKEIQFYGSLTREAEQHINNLSMVMQCCRGRNIVMDFTYVKDVVNANILVAQSDVTGVFNIGNCQRVTINDLVEVIIKLVGNNGIKPVYKDVRQGDILHSLADNTKAQSFGFLPEYTLEEGLTETVNYLKSQS